MFYVLQNESTAALRRVPILLTDAATGTTAQSGIALTTIFPYVNINGGAFIGGTGSVAEAGFGQYYYEMDVNETATLGLAGIHVTAESCRDYDAISQIAALNVYSSAGLGLTAGDVWNYDISAISTAGTAGSQLNLSALGGGSITAADVWDFDISSYNTPGNEAARKLYNVDYLASSYLDASISGVPSAVWTNSITGAFTVPEAGSYLYQLGTGATGFTPAGGAGLTAGDVWSYVTREITGGIADTVTSVTNDVNVSTASMTGIAGTVWTYASRTITGGLADTVTTLTDRSGFAITGGTITTVSDKTGYSLSSPQTFDLTGNITGSVSGSVGSVSGAVGSVTGSVGSVAGNVVGSVASVTAPVSITTAAMGSIGSTVWNYVLSDTQTADANLVSAGSGGVAITVGDVWSYNTRTLTSGAGITVIGAVQLVNGPYRLTSNQNNSDGILDILQNSVQEINLNLIDGNGAPASAAGYASVVNIYDVAGVAVTTYSPTVEYADGGVLTFELDTDVTATIGRYNLIVGLSGLGFNVKYGPLQILVRPL
jgi:hypothetical protein